MALESKIGSLTPPAITQSVINRVVATSMIGTMIEWYDFFIYGFLATSLAAYYFPQTDPIAQTLTAFMAFAIGLFFRPLGALLFGAMGDRLGRKATFMIAIFLMGSATALIGILPGYAQIGVTASVLVFLMRVIQGLSIGGAWGGAASLVAEYVPQEKRGYYGSFTTAAAPLAVVVANGVILLLNFILGKEAMAAWGWRIPFILSLILVFVSLYLRWKIEESPVFSGMKKSGSVSKAPLKEAFSEHGGLMLVGALISIGLGAGWYSAYFATVNHIKLIGKADPVTAATIMMIAGAVSFVAYILLGGVLVDKWGRKPVLILGYTLAAITWYPLYKLIPTGDPVKMGIAAVLLATWTAMYYGPYGSLFPEMFPAKVRYTAMSVAYHFPVGIFGGIAPYAMLWFTQKFNDPLAGVWFPVISVAVSAILGAIFLKETKKVDISK